MNKNKEHHVLCLLSENGGAATVFLVLLSLIIFFTGVLVLKASLWRSAIRDFPATESARHFLKNHPQVIEELGQVASLSDEDGDFSYNESRGEGSVDLAIAGAKGVAQAKVSLVKQSEDDWVIVSASYSNDRHKDGVRLESPEDWLKSVEEYLVQNNTAEAGRSCDLIAKAAPDDFYATYCQARILLAASKNDQAITMLTVLSQTNPYHDQPHSMLAEMMYVVGNKSGSLEHYQKSYEINGKPGLAAWVGRIMIELGRDEEGLSWLDKAKKEEFNSADMEYAYGQYYMRKNMPSLAEVSFNQALKLSPDYAAAEFALGDLCFNRNDFVGGLYHYERGLMLDSLDNSDKRHLLVDRLIGERRYDMAIYHLIKAVVSKPQDTTSLAWLSALYTIYGRDQDAQDTYSMATAIDPHQARSAWDQIMQRLQRDGTTQ